VPPLATYEQRPAWLRNPESFFYGFSTLAATRTRLQLAAFDALAGGAQQDGAVLTKPDGWRPDPTVAAALYDSVAAAPRPADIDLAVRRKKRGE
jgi:hypothetical protein